MRKLIASAAIALALGATAPFAVNANQLPQTPPNWTPLDPGEPRYYRQFDCKDWNSPDQ